MDYFYSETLNIENINGIHFLQDHKGTNYKSPWNDFGFIITFKVFYVNNKEKRDVGFCKILAKNYENTSLYFKEKESNEKTVNINDKLNDISSVVSLGQDLDFYKKINSIFSQDDAEDILECICDAGFHVGKYDDYSTWDGFLESVMRGSASAALLRKGYQIALGNYSPEKEFTITVPQLEESFDSIEFKFDTNRTIGKNNINILIGKNGTGKSHILKKLSETITGVIKSDENHPFFHKLIIVAFSPFESFYTESEIFNLLEEKHSKKSINNNKSLYRKRLHVNAYSYIGFKNEKGQHDLSHPISESARSIEKIIKYDKENSWWAEKTRFQVLIDTLSLCIDFDSVSLECMDGSIVEIPSNQPYLRKTLNKINYSKGIFFKKDGVVIPLSSGQIIYSYMIPAIIAELEEESLLVLDEPELYLHPELEVGIVNMLQYILNETQSYAIIATHSAIITREIDREAVQILRKNNGITTTNITTVQTYGESLDVIISDVFDDFKIKKPYQSEIKKYLSNQHSISSLNNYIGNDGLVYALSLAEDENFISFEDEDD
ncbi:AAA family ATPase [Aeromonas veronii]|uniref:AAA family ATPase n=1 Tax=Aeromonas veronii TaxID=654 RepID=UPI003BA13BE0